MRLARMLLAVTGATVLLGTLVSSAPAGRFRASESSFRASWTRMILTLGISSTECEVTLAGTLHSTTIAKVEHLVGYITEARVRNPCPRGQATMLRETLPWHLEYVSFTGSLPTSIASISAHLIGWSYRFQEPLGGTCLMTSTAAQPASLTFNLGASGIVNSNTIGGTIRCRGSIEAEARMSGTSSRIEGLTGAVITVTPI